VIQLAIVDSSRIFADALAARLGSEPDVRVLRCATGSAALEQAVNYSTVDVVLADAVLFPAIRPDGRDPVRLLAPRVPTPRTSTRTGGPASPAVVLLADRADQDLLATAVRAGIRGWVPRDATVADLVTAIREAANDGTWIPPRLLTAVLGDLIWAPPADDPTQLLLAQLTPREREVLSCLAEGLGRVEVAGRLQVSANTVRTHVQSILSKLGVNSAVAAVALARKAGSTPPALRAWSADGVSRPALV
jgi:DNA-binding NarL/FixJ family response regulator